MSIIGLLVALVVLPVSQGTSKGAFNGPSAIETRLESAGGDSQSSRPDGKPVGLTAVRYQPVLCGVDREFALTAVVSLLKPSSPTTVARFVTAVVVDSVQAQQGGWARPHVGKEVTKRQPALADGYSSIAIIGECMVPWVQTAALHVLPDPVDGSPCMSVRFLSRCEYFSLQAPATFSSAGSKVISADGYDSAAFATAPPVRSVRATNANLLLHRQAPVNAARNVDQFHTESVCQ